MNLQSPQPPFGASGGPGSGGPDGPGYPGGGYPGGGYPGQPGAPGDPGQPGAGAAQETPSALEVFGRDLTALAREDRLDPVIGRDDEIGRTVQVLSRRTKNNPILIGEPGVGKTAIVEGLAQRVAAGDVPSMLRMEVDSMPTEVDVAHRRVAQLELERVALATETDAASKERLAALEAELSDPGRPVGSFLFCGPTGRPRRPPSGACGNAWRSGAAPNCGTVLHTAAASGALAIPTVVLGQSLAGRATSGNHENTEDLKKRKPDPRGSGGQLANFITPRDLVPDAREIGGSSA